METQHKHSTKSNRVTVPFYNPPSRHYGQTPSEIIREARASVMNPPMPGIKPVLTSRPFTPKEKERTLFGNVKKRLSRPPSSFSLSYLQKPDSLARIKLPAIDTVLQKKTGQNSNFRGVHSLDNLVEEYEAEILEQDKHHDFRRLPLFRDSHSSPQERKMVRSSSMMEKISWKTPDKRSIYTISQGYMDDIVSHPSDNIYSEHSKNSTKFLLDLSTSRFSIVNGNKSDLQLMPHRMDDESSGKKTINSKGDFIQTREGSIIFSAEYDTDVSVQRNESKMAERQKAEREEKKQEVVEPPENANMDNEKEQKNDLISTKNTNILSTTDDSEDSIKLISNLKTENATEKSIETETVSDYLTLMRNGPINGSMKNQIFKEKEILELYETAEYYGVFFSPPNESQNKFQSNQTEKIGKNLEQGLKTDYLKSVEENIKNFDLKMKQLNESIETFEEKLNGRNRIYSSQKTEGTEVPLEEVMLKKNGMRQYNATTEEMNTKGQSHENFRGIKHLSVDKDKQDSLGWDGFWKNSYYKQSGEIENIIQTENSGMKQLEEILTRLTKLDKNYAQNSDIVNVMDELYRLLKEGDYLSKYVVNNDVKMKIIRSLYCFADNEDSEVLLNLSRIVFALRMDTSLLDACKMVFKVARSDANDQLFLELEDILELFLYGIGLASPLEAPECCIYGYGALKFLTMNHRILSRLISLGVLDLLILHLKMINSAKLEGELVNEQSQHALFQLTGALRNIATGEGVLPVFITTNSIPILCKILIHFRESEDLVTNISRILSILSADEDSTEVLMSVENILEIIMGLIDRYQSNDKILIRLAYCLGNIVAYSDLARIQLSRSEGSVRTLLTILQLYLDKDLELSMKENEITKGESMNTEIVEDIIVKIIRIIANMCMNPVVGSNLSPNESNEENSMKLAQILTIILFRKDPGIVLLACLGCLNNISYYCSNHSSLIDITAGIIRVLGLHDEECQAEAARVLGNLTRHKEIRKLNSSTGGVERLSRLLESRDKEVYKSACGALVNLMLDQETRKIFTESHGIDKLVAGLEKFARDWSFAGLICRAIWNSCADDIETALMHNNVEALLNVLASSLDEENWNDGEPAWEEFAFLATDLLEKINAHLDRQTK